MPTTFTPLSTPFTFPPLIVHAKQRRLSVEEYHRMGDLGLLKPDERVELIHGLLVEKPVVTPPHAFAVTKLQKFFDQLVPVQFLTRVQLPITLSDSEPEPDLVIARQTESEYFDRHPGPDNIRLVVEVAVSSLAFDQGEKLALYAAQGVETYWIANLVDKRFEVYTHPHNMGAPAYLNVQHFPHGTNVPLVLDGITIGSIAVSDVIK
jgi:Putative restriction endonuclease